MQQMKQIPIISNEDALMKDRSILIPEELHDEKSQFYLKVNRVRRIGSDSQLRTPFPIPGDNEYDNRSQDCFPTSPFSFSSDEVNMQNYFGENAGETDSKNLTFFPENQSYLTKATQRVGLAGIQAEEKQTFSRKINKPSRISFQHIQEDALGSVKSASSTYRKSSKRHSTLAQGNWPPHSSPRAFGESVVDQAPSTRRSSTSEFIADLHEGSSQQQQRWRNKVHSQAHAASPRLMPNRLRLSQQQDLLADIKARRKSKLRRRRTSRMFKIPTTPLDRFRRMVRLVRLLIRCLVDYQRVTVVSQTSQMSFAMLSNDMVATRTYRHGLTFDPNDYKVSKETLLNDKLREILTILPHQRTKHQVEYALKCLRAEVEEFAEFPLKLQQALVKVAWLDEFEPKRIIIRQGHKAETFYFILYGTALVTRNRINACGEGYVETVSILRRGKSFGELAIMRREQRTHNVVSQTRLALLNVGRKDFIEIFMHRKEGGEPEFISFLRKIPEFEGYPLYKIPHNKPTICAFTYFRVGVVICSDSSKSDMIVIVRSGVCRVIKRLPAAKPNVSGLRDVADKCNYEEKSLFNNQNLPSQSFGLQRPVVLTGPSSPVSLMVGPRHPNLRRRFTLSLIQAGKPSLSEDPTLKAESKINEALSQSYHKAIEQKSSSQDHKRKIWNRYRTWQEDHPISKETFALLMTGRGLQDQDDESNDDNNDVEESDDKFDVDHQMDGSIVDRKSQEDEAQSNFRISILKRNRSSLADAWQQRQRKKMSSVASNLPTLNERKLSKLARTGSRSNSAAASTNRSVYIHIQTLREGDVFGLIPIVFDKSDDATSMSLISDGAECILINRDFFLKYFDSELREKLVRMVQPYPSDGTLEANLQNQTNWDAYKFMTVHSLVVNRMRMKQART